MPTAAHFLYIPGVLILGIVLGWILGSRAAADAYASQLRKTNPRREETGRDPKWARGRSMENASRFSLPRSHRVTETQRTLG